MDYKIQWAKEQIKQLETIVKGYGFDAIQAKLKLQKIRSLSEEEFIEAAITAYDANH
jgi:glyoxylate carboligase